MRSYGIEGNIKAEILAFLPEHPHLRLPVHFAPSLEERLRSSATADEPTELHNDGEAELQEPGRWGTRFTLAQCRRRCAA